MFAFFGEVLGFFEAAWNYFINFVESLITALVMVTSSTSFVMSIIQYVPAILGSSIAIFIVIYTVKFLIGR